jgi:sugar (pentulose or hexulose) kinase
MQGLGAPDGHLITTGGSTRSSLWVQLQADIFNRPVYTSGTVESTAAGALISLLI